MYCICLSSASALPATPSGLLEVTNITARLDAAVLTSDPEDIRQLGPNLRIHRV